MAMRQLRMRAMGPNLMAPGASAAAVFGTGGEGMNIGPKLDAHGSLDKVGQGDEGFSAPGLRDFLLTLHGKVSRAAAAGDFSRIARYVSPPVQQALTARYRAIERIDDVLVGRIELDFVDHAGHTTKFGVRMAILRDVVRDGQPVSEYVDERWELRRSSMAKSHSPTRMLELGCQKCGSSEPLDGNRCPACDTRGAEFQFHGWVVMEAEVSLPLSMPPTDPVWLPTADQPVYLNGGEPMKDYQANHPDFDLDAMLAHASSVCSRVWMAVGHGDFEALRRFGTMYAMHTARYFHRRAGPVAQAIEVEQAGVARVATDPHFDRIWVWLNGEADGSGFAAVWTFRRRHSSDEWRLDELDLPPIRPI
jgi:predicted lipid-binding transport protein (Tim44 family)